MKHPPTSPSESLVESNYFVLWFPAVTVCAIVSGYLVVIWTNAPKIPSQGMEALVGLPYAMASAVMLPFVLGLAFLLWRRPKAWRASSAVPTIVLTLGAVAAWFLLPRAQDAPQILPMVFVDTAGEPVSGLHVRITYSSPGFDLLKGRRDYRSENFQVASAEFVLSKKRGEQADVVVTKEGFYSLALEVSHVWPADRKTGLQKLGIRWQKDLGRGEWGVDACTGAMNFPLSPSTPLRVIMLATSQPARIPIPEYSEEDFRQFQASLQTK